MTNTAPERIADLVVDTMYDEILKQILSSRITAKQLEIKKDVLKAAMLRATTQTVEYVLGGINFKITSENLPSVEKALVAHAQRVGARLVNEIFELGANKKLVN